MGHLPCRAHGFCSPAHGRNHRVFTFTLYVSCLSSVSDTGLSAIPLTVILSVACLLSSFGGNMPPSSLVVCKGWYNVIHRQALPLDGSYHTECLLHQLVSSSSFHLTLPRCTSEHEPSGPLVATNRFFEGQLSHNTIIPNHDK